MKALATVVIATALTAIAVPTTVLGASTQTIAIDAGSLPSVRTIKERFRSFQIGMSHLAGGTETEISMRFGGAASATDIAVIAPKSLERT